ncbi:MAG: hypothetical protein RL670_690 [Actinomycetota bacterium]|jgi:hypothetical protein
MGRGRQKAKHTKVARELKYFSPNTDLSALEREIGHPDQGDEPEYVDKWADLYGDEAEGAEEGEDSADESGSDSADGGSASSD